MRRSLTTKYTKDTKNSNENAIREFSVFFVPP
jgi:hypothetical protein